MAGSIELGGRVVAGDGRCLPPERRDLGVVFQSAALWPHLSALDNVAYPLRRNGYGRQAARAEALRLLGQLHLARLAERCPAELSGGEQQRVGLARALARQAGLFLFDEPTAHLDAHLRDVFLEEIARQRAARGTAALLATHDAAEALAVADLVAVLDDGGLAQVGTPQEVYQRPATLTVARLTGPVSVLDGGTGNTVVRPDWVLLGPGDASAVLVAVRFRGPFTDYLLRTPRGTLVAREPGPPRHEPDDPISYTLTRTWTVARR
jgi:ABC-type Fe3+/spermidine/putrescine transport system ATPase subunit